MTETISHIALKDLKSGRNDFQVLPHVSVSTDSEGHLVIDAPAIGVSRLLTNDLIELTGKDSFRWLGRADDVINMGGLKLHPASIEERLAPYINSPFIIAALPDERLGQVPLLVLQTRGTDISQTAANLQSAQYALSKQESPRYVCFTDIPLFNERGKANRMAFRGQPMYTTHKYIILLCICLTMILTACSPSEPSPETTDNAGGTSSGSTTGSYSGNPNTRRQDAFKTSVSFKLTNAVQEGGNDLYVRSIFENKDTETAFGQDVVEYSALSAHFADTRPYNDPNSYYLIDMATYRVVQPRVMNRVFYEKTYVFQFALYYRNYKNTQSPQTTAQPNNLPPKAPMGYIITQIPITVKDNGSMSPVSIYGQALDRFIEITYSRGYYKTAEQIERENASVPPPPQK
ncbi:hypothetical protein CHS0354_030108 [Potamilus streckersoni]|uniref:Uncharacterized protein n=1 Tax=Potamilus streckersoni TaxID=2493646 RepID=A0AAE0VEX0_9BIVA|nr:hypothetical protein CHS0354_030108 [Potamilus streckersoni]